MRQQTKKHLFYSTVITTVIGVSLLILFSYGTKSVPYLFILLLMGIFYIAILVILEFERELKETEEKMSEAEKRKEIKKMIMGLTSSIIASFGIAIWFYLSSDMLLHECLIITFSHIWIFTFALIWGLIEFIYWIKWKRSTNH